MDKETLSHYGWIVVLILVLSVMLALATPFGDYVGNGVVSIARGFVGTGNTALSDDNIDNLGNKYDDMLNACSHENTQKVNEKEETCETDGYTGDIVCTKCNKVLTKGQVIPKLNHKNTEIKNKTDTYTGDVYCKGCGKLLQKGESIRPVIPEGGIYYTGVTYSNMVDHSGVTYTRKYLPGEEFPEISDGDVYTYQDFEYRYNKQFGSNGWTLDKSLQGWGVKSKAPATKNFRPILKEINGKPITSLCRTFNQCFAMETAPEIPDTVKNMKEAFDGASKLKTPPKIPNSVTNLYMAFYGCKAMTELPDISKTKVKDLSYTFYNCSSITDASSFVIPSTVTKAQSTFHGCSSLVSAPDLTNTNLGYINGMFSKCSSLVNIKGMPPRCTYIESMFYGCTSLTDASHLIIPETVKDMCALFCNCTSLGGTITINTTEDTLNWSSHVPLQNVLNKTKITSVYQILGKLERDRKQQIINESSY